MKEMQSELSPLQCTNLSSAGAVNGQSFYAVHTWILTVTFLFKADSLFSFEQGVNCSKDVE